MHEIDVGTASACFEHVRLVGAVLVREGRILLGRRSRRKRICPGLWDVIGGHVEAEETYEDALRRELREEIGVNPTSFRVLGQRPLSRIARSASIASMHGREASRGSITTSTFRSRGSRSPRPAALLIWPHTASLPPSGRYDPRCVPG
jgi:8-oxo-dGTP pyrophosphatase MutT (NUDIX family)